MTINALDEAFFRLFRLRGVFDPSTAVPGLGASVSEIMAMAFLSDQAVTQQQLGRLLGLEKSTVSRLVDAMAAKGWATRERDPENRRHATVSLTGAGRRAARRVGDAMRRRHEAMLESMTAHERATMIQGLTLLVTALEREYAKTGRPG